MINYSINISQLDSYSSTLCYRHAHAVPCDGLETITAQALL